jgi:hypothetical protein
MSAVWVGKSEVTLGIWTGQATFVGPTAGSGSRVAAGAVAPTWRFKRNLSTYCNSEHIIAVYDQAMRALPA